MISIDSLKEFESAHGVGKRSNVSTLSLHIHSVDDSSIDWLQLLLREKLGGVVPN